MKRLFGFLIIVILAGPQNAAAENVVNPLKMEELAIQIMPEYSYHPKDTKKEYPPLLIGYQGTFLNISDQPQKGKIEIPLPSNQKNLKIGYVADYSTDLSELYEIEYMLDKENGIISWETSREVQPGDIYKFIIEFYSDGMIKESDTRNLEYVFKSFADIDLVNITFLEPLKTESTKLIPEPEAHKENPYGMNMFLYTVQGMKMGEEKTIQLTYKRSSSKTTIELMDQIDGNHEKKTIKPKKVESKELYLVIGGIGVFSMISAILLILFLKKRKPNNVHPIIKTQTSEINEKGQLRNKLIQGEISKLEYDQLVKKMQ